MIRISPETLRELDARELAVCRIGAALDALEASHTKVDPEDYAKALAEWQQEITALIEIRKAVLVILSGA